MLKIGDITVYRINDGDYWVAAGTPNYNDLYLSNIGVVFTFQRLSDESWTLKETIYAASPQSNQNFGNSVSIEANNGEVYGAASAPWQDGLGWTDIGTLYILQNIQD